jgi:hypothetical protein
MLGGSGRGARGAAWRFAVTVIRSRGLGGRPGAGGVFACVFVLFLFCRGLVLVIVSRETLSVMVRGVVTPVSDVSRETPFVVCLCHW